MIKVENLTKRYGQITAVDGISFEVETGQIVGFLGPNGAGKTTTMRMLTGYFPPTNGTATIAGFDISKDAIEVKKRLGYLPEHVPIYKDMQLEKYLEFAYRAKKGTSAGSRQSIEKVLSECDLAHVRKRIIKTLSRGFQQRVGLAQALVADPEILILDEPTIGLDPKQIIEIRNLIKNLAGKRTVILCSHILHEVDQICQKVIIINRGKIVAQDTPENLTREVNKTRNVIVAAQGESSTVCGLIKQINGIENIEIVKEHYPITHYRIQHAQDTDPRSDIAKSLVANDIALWEMTPEFMTLEDIFVKLTNNHKVLDNTGETR